MSITYRIDPVVGITFVAYDGIVTGEELEAHTRRLMADPAWPPAKKLHLTDMTSQTRPDLLPVSALVAMAELWGTRPRELARMKIATVANDGFDNARQFEATIHKHGPSMIVFNVLSTACTWLGIEIAQAEAAIKELRADARKVNTK